MKHLLLAAGLLTSVPALAQISGSLPEAKLHVTLPNAQWPAFTRQVVGDRIVYQSKRQAILDKHVGPITPHIALTLEPVPASVELVTFSQALLQDLTEASASDNQPLRLLTEYHFGGPDKLLPSPNIVAYKISYPDKQSFTHLVYVVHLLSNGMGVQLMADTTENIAAQLTPEFEQTIRSIRLLK